MDSVFNYTYGKLIKSKYKPIQTSYVSYDNLKVFCQKIWKHYSKSEFKWANVIYDSSNHTYAINYLKTTKNGHKILGAALKIYDEIACIAHLLVPIDNKYYFIRDKCLKITILLRSLHLYAAIHRSTFKHIINVYLPNNAIKPHNFRIKQLCVVNNILEKQVLKKISTCDTILKPWATY